MTTCGLYFGSFNPFHIGHLAIANYLVSFTSLDSVRIVLSPRNPLKANEFIPESQLLERLEQIRGVIQNRHLNIQVSDVEFHLSMPHYTIRTLEYLHQSEPDVQFIPVFGADILAQMERWYRWQDIMREYSLWLYPRQGYDLQALCEKYRALAKDLRILDAPLVTISSTFIREGMAQGKNMNGFLAL